MVAIWLFSRGLVLADALPPDASSSATAALIGPYFTAASLFAATSGWLVSNAVSILSRMREKASDFIRIAQADEEFLSALSYIGILINHPTNREKLRDIELVRDLYEDPAGMPLRIHMRRALNVFDEMAIFIRRGAADEEILRDFYSGMLIRFFESYRVFLPLIMNVPKIYPAKSQRPEIPENTLWLYRRWVRHYSREYFYGEGRDKIELTGPWFRRVKA